MKRPSLTLTALAALVSVTALAQAPDGNALEGVIVERYYVADANDVTDEDGSAQLVEGAVTYRVFLDMKEGYTLQYISGELNHPLSFTTTTSFFNNEDRGESWGDAIGNVHLDENTVAIDSWLCMGAASDLHWGILKEDDPDGSIVGGPNNDGGSNGVPAGLLSNTNGFPIPLTQGDGLLLTEVPPPALTFLGDFPECFNSSGASYSSENAGLGVLDTLICPTPGNKILVGQFTTDGVFSFCLNVWLHIPDSLICVDCPDHLEFFPQVFLSDTGETAGLLGDYRFGFPTLCWSSDQQAVDCLGVPGGPALPGTACDDGNTNTENDVYGNDCLCIGQQVGIIEHADAVVKVYPNPAHEALFLEITEATGDHITVDLLDALGAQVIRHDLGAVSGTRRERLDLSGLSAGVYFLETTIADRPQRTRITKF